MVLLTISCYACLSLFCFCILLCNSNYMAYFFCMYVPALESIFFNLAAGSSINVSWSIVEIQANSFHDCQYPGIVRYGSEIMFVQLLTIFS